MTDVESKLKSLFASPTTGPDESFVNRVDRAIMAEEKMLAARAAMWLLFAFELVGTAAVVTAFYLLWNIAPSGTVDPLMNAPGMAGGMVILLWLAVQLKPLATAR